MDAGQIKLYVINASTLGVTTFTTLEMGLKILLLVVTIGYTIDKWLKLRKERNENKTGRTIPNSSCNQERALITRALF